MHRCLLALLAWCACAVPLSCGPAQTTIATGEKLPEDQWSRGVWLYGQHCAGCHGEDGEGDEDAPPLAGDGALPQTATWADGERTTKFDTAADVFSYVKAEMPPMEAGGLKDEQYWAIMFYMLKQANVKVGEPPMDASNAPSVALR